eukprot:scaffold231289_cov21-Tisochrysis_lutea.AAC.1
MSQGASHPAPFCTGMHGQAFMCTQSCIAWTSRLLQVFSTEKRVAGKFMPDTAGPFAPPSKEPEGNTDIHAHMDVHEHVSALQPVNTPLCSQTVSIPTHLVHQELGSAVADTSEHPDDCFDEA